MNDIKPLLRWIIGPVRQEGLHCLRQSVINFKRIYPEFDLLICHNQLNKKQMGFVQSLGVPMFDQSNSINAFPIEPKYGYQVHNKLYPPRINKNTHEIIMDNDIVLFKRVMEIDLFIANDATLLYEGLHGLHGSYNNHIPIGIKINSGIFGMPPGFDFIEIMQKTIQLFDWNDRFDEQGLVGATLLKHHKHYTIPLSSVPIIEAHNHLINNCQGFHFVGINYHNHPSGVNYLKTQMLM